MSIRQKIIVTLFLFFLPCLMGDTFSRGDDTRTEAPEIYSTNNSWGANFSIGTNYTDGNVDFFAFSSSVSAFKHIDDHYFNLQGSYVYREVNGDAIFDKLQAFLRYDYFLSDLWRIFVLNTHSRNQFLDLDYRVTIGVGVWYDIFLNDTIQNGISFAPIYNYEQFAGDIDDETIELSFRNIFKWHIGEGVEFVADVFFIPNANNFDDYRFFGLFYFETKIYSDTLFLRVSLQEEYDSKPQDDIKHSDVIFTTSLVFKFGSEG
ncbi:DUF481 domain-containing protein [Candidatus Uabimicrobium sp. HlEnr_7]|uniref:DUF481 domain-containing protein n=1 Tax=Candidatus Uabimicrobium helgolandensis TaxID=3095367 RepID=UPI0035580BE4